MYLHLNFTEGCSSGPSWQYISIGLCNCWVPKRHQAINSTNVGADLCQSTGISGQVDTDPKTFGDAAIWHLGLNELVLDSYFKSLSVGYIKYSSLLMRLYETYCFVVILTQLTLSANIVHSKQLQNLVYLILYSGISGIAWQLFGGLYWVWE